MSTHNTPEKKQLSSYELIQKNFELAVAKGMAVVPTQPLQVVMRHQQAALGDKANPRALSVAGAFKEVVQKGNPVQSLMKGGIVAASKEVVKSLVYRGALIKGAPSLADKLLPNWAHDHLSPTQYLIVQSVVAGGIAGLSDNVLGGPLERWATFLATSQGKHSEASFKAEFKLQSTALGKAKYMYKGFVTGTAKSSVAFATYFGFSDYIHQGCVQMYGFSPNAKLPWYVIASSALGTGLVVAGTSSALDIAKTQRQMPGAQDVKLVTAIKNNYKTHGMRGVTAGMLLKGVQITVGWGLTFFVMNDTPKHGAKVDKVDKDLAEHIEQSAIKMSA